MAGRRTLPKASICAWPPGTRIFDCADSLPGSVSRPAAPVEASPSAGSASCPGWPGTIAAVTRTPRSVPAPGSGHSSTVEPIGSTVTAPSATSGVGCCRSVARRVRTATTASADEQGPGAGDRRPALAAALAPAARATGAAGRPSSAATAPESSRSAPRSTSRSSSRRSASSASDSAGAATSGARSSAGVAVAEIGHALQLHLLASEHQRATRLGRGSGLGAQRQRPRRSARRRRGRDRDRAGGVRAGPSRRGRAGRRAAATASASARCRRT